MIQFASFVKQWLRDNLKPLEKDADSSFPTWLTNTNYPHWKKLELLTAYESLDNAFQDRNFLVNKCFVKQETYLDFKYPRGIYSRSDTAKMHIGPLVKLIEEEVYKNPYFIKHVPVSERPRYIKEHVYNPNCSSYLATDYTAFESQFVKELMVICEIEMLKHMTQHVHDRAKFWWILDNVLAGTNECRFRKFTMYIEATRMSGEMTTSLSNGFSNLMFFLFTSQQCGLKNIKGVIEGDDGLFSYDLPPGATIPNEADFARLGLTIKIEKHEKLSTASFCGMVFDETEQVPLTDPIKAISNLGWIDRRFLNARNSKLRSLLRCKALSMKSQYPACPVLDAAASWVLRCTAGCQTERILARGTFGTYRTEQMLSNIKGYARFDRDASTGERTRQLMAEKYGVPVNIQLQLENWFDSQTYLCPIPSHLFGDCIPSQWKVNFERFVTLNGTHPNVDHTPDHRVSEAEDLIRNQIITRRIRKNRPPKHVVSLFQHAIIDKDVRATLVNLRP